MAAVRGERNGLLDIAWTRWILGLLHRFNLNIIRVYIGLYMDISINTCI